MTQIREWVHGGSYCIVWVLVSWKVNLMSGSEHSSSIETDLQ